MSFVDFFYGQTSKIDGILKIILIFDFIFR